MVIRKQKHNVNRIKNADTNFHAETDSEHTNKTGGETKNQQIMVGEMETNKEKILQSCMPRGGCFRIDGDRGGNQKVREGGNTRARKRGVKRTSQAMMPNRNLGAKKKVGYAGGRGKVFRGTGGGTGARVIEQGWRIKNIKQVDEIEQIITKRA